MNKTIPMIFSLSSVTIWTHLISHRVLHHKSLLKNCSSKNLCLDLELHLEPLAVGLRPEEARIDQLDLLQPLESLEADGHQLSALQGCLDPLSGRLEISLTKSTELDCHLNIQTLIEIS